MYVHEFELTKEPSKSSADFWKIVKNIEATKISFVQLNESKSEQPKHVKPGNSQPQK